MIRNKKNLMGAFKISNPKNITLLILMLAILILFTLLLPNRFLTGRNFQSMLAQFPEFGLLALAMMIAMIVGGIDLSVVATANLAGVVAAIMLATGETAGVLPAGLLILLTVLAVIAISIVCGALNGTLIALAGVPPILATLGTQGLYMGLAIILTKGHGITGFPEEFLFVGNDFILGLPVPFIIFMVMALLVAFILRRTRQGFNMYMVGANPIVARFSGVNNTMVLLKTYILSGVLAGAASIIMISRANSMRPGYGTAYLLQAILVSVLGGTDPKGGVGNVLGLVLGIMILQFTQSGFNILSFSPFVRKFIWGLALLLIMVVNFLLAKYNEKKRIRLMRESAKAGA